MKRGLTLTAIALVALATTGCGNRLSQPMPGPTPEATTPHSAQSTLNAGGQAGGPLVPGNYPPSATAAPVAQAAAPPAAREFTVYFATNKATLTPEAHSVIQQAVAAAKQAPMTHITVTGHTDTVGTAKYNQRLSVRRADAVRKELIAEGVSADEITASGVGKSDPAVPTGQGVNEPRNRRVVITEGRPGA
jgi:OmpA-OmpF porin, OOP family